MKNILIPTDFSENAWNAVKYAIELFKNEQCNIYLLNTYTPNISASRFMATAVYEEKNTVENSSKKGLINLLRRIEKEYPDPAHIHNFKTISSFSFLVDEVKELVDDYNIQMVILGTKGASGVSEVFMGSNAVRIIKAVKKCPVLAIPEHFEYETPKEIAFATDFNRFYTLSELQPLLELAETFEAVIRIVYVQNKIKALTEVQQFNLNMLRRYLNTTEYYIHTISEMNSVSNTLEVFTAELQVHLLAMLNYQHSYMERMTREPIVKKMAFHTQLPLLVLPEMGIGLMPKKDIPVFSANKL
ncbi:universal stress protein [Cellulophaga baltica]|uniref:universal stress protein n=1 Tax=Cellulophaga TaxID=104264 RepID=UPI001C06B163|nr:MULTISPECIES: universal stress protein [Cellulophaga]MBU2995252.1 universal stress protein [Cellulophaga baltica]MDO6766647.1 universal stress protein [Cellulophaga sp. 1_MG-2023]